MNPSLCLLHGNNEHTVSRMLSVVRKVLLIISPADSVSVFGPYLAPLTCVFSPPSSLTHSVSPQLKSRWMIEHKRACNRYWEARQGCCNLLLLLSLIELFSFSPKTRKRISIFKKVVLTFSILQNK